MNKGKFMYHLFMPEFAPPYELKLIEGRFSLSSARRHSCVTKLTLRGFRIKEGRAQVVCSQSDEKVRLQPRAIILSYTHNWTILSEMRPPSVTATVEGCLWNSYRTL